MKQQLLHLQIIHKKMLKLLESGYKMNLILNHLKQSEDGLVRKNAQGVIIFSSSEIIKTGESVKFGIKTDKPNAVINWKGLDQNNEVIKVGAIRSDDLQNSSL